LIRSAVREDIPQLVSLFINHQKAMGCSWSLDPVRLSMTFSQAIALPDNWLCLTGGGCLFLASCFESPLGAGKIATELCFCVSSGQLQFVLDQYENWARSKGCISVSLSCMQRFPAFQRLYGRYGYSLAEMTTAKAL